MLAQVLVAFRRRNRPQTLMPQNTWNSSLYHVTLSKSHSPIYCPYNMFFDETSFGRKEKYSLQRNYLFHKELPPSLSLSPSLSLYLRPLNVHMRKCMVLMTAWTTATIVHNHEWTKGLCLRFQHLGWTPRTKKNLKGFQECDFCWDSIFSRAFLN